MNLEERVKATADLEVAFEELRSDEGLEMFVEGHGLQSRRFVWNWSDEKRGIEISLPYARVLSSEEIQADDDDKIEAAIRMAMLLLALGDEAIEGRIEISNGEDGTEYRLWSADGTLEESGRDWSVLARRLEALLTASGEEDLRIILP